MTERVEQPRAMTDMERLCRAICWQWHGTGHSGCACAEHGGCQAPARNFEHSYLPVVRAVLKELREPTPDMIQAGYDSPGDMPISSETERKRVVDVIYKGMIDTILQEAE